MHQTIQGLKIAFENKRYYRNSIIGGLILLVVYYFLFTQVTSVSNFIAMTKGGDFGQYSVAYSVAYLIIATLTIIFFGISIGLMSWLWNRSKFSPSTDASSWLGAVVAALGVACPICGAFLLSLFGVTTGVALFPLKGLEFQVIGLVLIMVSVFFASRKVEQLKSCGECEITTYDSSAKTHLEIAKKVDNRVVYVLIVLFVVNYFLINRVANKVGINIGFDNIFQNSSFKEKFRGLFSISNKATYSVIAPKLNSDGRTTSLTIQPTITEVPANPNTGDLLADARVVMIPTGKPFYAPDDISFNNPIEAQNKWMVFENQIQLTSDLQQRYDDIISNFTCNYCCGGPNTVTAIVNCGCKHAKAWRGFFKYMLTNYKDKYSNEQLMGEAYRWTGIWYPKGVLEDYLLATDKTNQSKHSPHGGSGSGASRHGL